MNTKIGLEIHIPLNSKQKLFCDCKTNYYEISEPNLNTCPVCTGMPGIKPYPINQRSLESAVMIALLLNCKINDKIFVKRKHYDYPDLPSGYQRTSEPIGVDGNLNNIGIWEVHIEEDPGRYDLDARRVDYNRSGVSLVEIVTAPDMKSPEDARNFLKELVNLLKYTGRIIEVGGVMRADVNISIEGGARVEIKNINSIKGAFKALNYEILRQKNLMRSGKTVFQETRGFDEKQMITIPLRTKETADDYRYIPDPDIPPLLIKQIFDKIKLPETPQSRKKRIIEDYGIQENFAEILVKNKDLADVFEEICSKNKNLSQVASLWICQQVIRQLNYRGIEYNDVECKLNTKILTELFELIQQNEITENVGKKMVERIIDSGESPKEIVKKENLNKLGDDEHLVSVAVEVINSNPKVVEDYKTGKKEALNFLMGQVMKQTKGRAEASKVIEILKKNIKS